VLKQEERGSEPERNVSSVSGCELETVASRQLMDNMLKRRICEKSPEEASEGDKRKRVRGFEPKEASRVIGTYVRSDLDALLRRMTGKSSGRLSRRRPGEKRLCSIVQFGRLCRIQTLSAKKRERSRVSCSEEKRIAA